MESVELQCGHFWLYKTYRPEGAVYCARCDAYKLPVVLEKCDIKPRVKRLTNLEGRVSSKSYKLPKYVRPLKVAEAKKLHIDGMKIKDIAEQMGFSAATIQKWLKE